MTKNEPMSADPWPVELRYDRAARTLRVSFDDGSAFDLGAEYLRVESPSAELKGHGGPVMIPGGKRDVGIEAIEPVGRYAVRIVFDDGHRTGLYSWRLLHQLGREFDTRWATYLQELEKRGLSREG